MAFRVLPVEEVFLRGMDGVSHGLKGNGLGVALPPQEVRGRDDRFLPVAIFFLFYSRVQSSPSEKFGPLSVGLRPEMRPHSWPLSQVWEKGEGCLPPALLPNLGEGRNPSNTAYRAACDGASSEMVFSGPSVARDIIRAKAVSSSGLP